MTDPGVTETRYRRVPRYPDEPLEQARFLNRYPRPWTVAEHDQRVFVIAANGRRVCEVEPGQLRGDLPTHADAMALAEAICDA